MRRRVVVPGVFFGILLLVSGSFASGYVASRADALDAPLASVESLLERVGVGAVRAASNASADVESLFKPFWEAWDLIGKQFYDESAVDQDKLFRGAIKGMVSAVGDPYTLYMDPQHRELSEAELRGTFDGIGIQVEMTEQQLRVISPISGSPGERAGLKPGDVIIRVDGLSIRGMPLGDSIRLIRGARGSPVTLTIQRDNSAPFDVSITREQIRVDAVRGEVRSDGVAYIKITTFSSGVGGQLRRAVEQMQEKSPIGWVLDLRGNPGGTLDGAISVASQFMNEGVVLYEQRRDGQKQEIRRRGDAKAANGPMAILVDKGSASASEIVAAALRDNGRATLIGDTTYGKGLVQVVHRLSDGSALRLTIARWLTPNQELIQGVGLTPALGSEPGDGDQLLLRAVAFVRTEAAHAAAEGQAAGSALAPTPVGRSAAVPDDESDGVAALDAAERESASPRALA